MADIVSRGVRSRMMAGIRDRNTKPEMLIRSELHKRGFRFRLHVRNLPGRPDIVLPKLKAVIFVHGCFWHAHNCHLFRLPSTRSDWWREKLSRNRSVDMRSRSALLDLEWRVLEIYECALKGKERLPLEHVIHQAESWLQKGAKQHEIRGSKDARKKPRFATELPPVTSAQRRELHARLKQHRLQPDEPGVTLDEIRRKLTGDSASQMRSVRKRTRPKLIRKSPHI